MPGFNYTTVQATNLTVDPNYDYVFTEDVLLHATDGTPYHAYEGVIVSAQELLQGVKLLNITSRGEISVTRENITTGQTEDFPTDVSLVEIGTNNGSNAVSANVQALQPSLVNGTIHHDAYSAPIVPGFKYTTVQATNLTVNANDDYLLTEDLLLTAADGTQYHSYQGVIVTGQQLIAGVKLLNLPNAVGIGVTQENISTGQTEDFPTAVSLVTKVREQQRIERGTSEYSNVATVAGEWDGPSRAVLPAPIVPVQVHDVTKRRTLAVNANQGYLLTEDLLLSPADGCKMPFISRCDCDRAAVECRC